MTTYYNNSNNPGSPWGGFSPSPIGGFDAFELRDKN